jgi:type I restriction enzyme, R subunit
MDKPEEKARVDIDQALAEAGWRVQSLSEINIHAARGVAVREFPLQRGHGFADYLLYVSGKAVGAIEAKRKGETLTGVEVQTEKYSMGLRPSVPAYQRPLPFLYQSTGVETRFTNMLDPEPRSRRVFHFHQPETFVDWLESVPVDSERGNKTVALQSTLRSRLHMLLPLGMQGLWPAQHKAVMNLEKSLKEDRPRSLIQMATGSGGGSKHSV